MNRPALFLDRDGVVNQEIGHLHRPDDVVLMVGAAQVIARMNAAGVPVVVVTNQGGIAKGLYGEAELAAVQQRIAALLAPAWIDAVYHCPHHPEAVVAALRQACECRKPRPGMLLRAAAELGLDLPRSVLVGDKLSDLEAARAVGATGVLVRTGHGRAEEIELDPALGQPVWDSLAAGLPWLVEKLSTIRSAHG